MDVRAIDVDDDPAFRRFHEIIETADSFERPWADSWTFEELALHFRKQDRGERWDAFAAFDGDTMVGAGFVAFPMLDNVDKCWAGFFVEPGRRRRGAGHALVEHGRDLARTEERRELLVEAAIPFDALESHPYRRFADDVGARIGFLEVHRILRLPMPPGKLESMLAEAAPHHTGYELRTYQDGLPEDLIESWCFLENQIAVDAPTGEVDFEPEGLTPELYRERLAKQLAQGRHRLTTVAVADGEAVAMTELVIPREDPPKVQQWSTIVRHDHRGHRLGTAVKLVNLQALMKDFPERTEIHTSNEESNAHMVGINEAMGFEAVEYLPTFTLPVSR